MGCSRRVKFADIKPEQKWDFISLNDFKSTSCLEPFAYAYLWVSLIISVAVYGVDTFTAVNLLAFDKWAGSIQPKVPLNISKWIFSGCIILSWLNLGFEYVRAGRVMRRGAVAESYLDSLAVRVQSIRVGEGRGWRRFLVFAELTKSKKGAEYVALFTYFSFQSWIRVIFCQGPRQVVNALTLYSVYVAQLNPAAENAGASFLGFFKNIGILAEKEHQAAVILSGMLFTLVIWVFAALSLIVAILFYVFFLWHYIPNADGGLTGYCERKINGRLTRIVSAKVNKALADEERKKMKAAAKAAKKGQIPVIGRQATLPTLYAEKSDDKLPNMPMLQRNDTMTTLPLYTSRPGTPGSQVPAVPAFELKNFDQNRPGTARTETNESAMSYGSNAPLIGGASDMGYGRSSSPAPSMPASEASGFPFPQRTYTGSSASSQWQNGPLPNRGPPTRQMTQDSFNSSMGPPRQMTPGYPMDPIRQMTPSSQRGPPTRQMTNDSFSPRGPPTRQMTNDSFTTSPGGYSNSPGGYSNSPGGYSENFSCPRPQGPEAFGRNMPEGRSSPAPTLRAPQYPPQQRGNNFVSPLHTNSIISNVSETSNYSNPSQYGGQRSASAALPVSSQSPPPQRLYRNMTEPMQPSSYGTRERQEYFGNQPPSAASRPGPSQHERIGSADSYDPYRSASPAPGNYGGRPAPGSGPQGGYRI